MNGMLDEFLSREVSILVSELKAKGDSRWKRLEASQREWNSVRGGQCLGKSGELSENLRQALREADCLNDLSKKRVLEIHSIYK